MDAERPLVRVRVVSALATLLLLAFAGGQLHGQVNNYVVGPQDVLTIALFDQQDLSGKYTVEADGTFTFPLIGRVKAGGLTLRSVEEALRKELSNGFFKNPQVSVAVEQYRSQRVFVVGEVRAPGTYPLTGDTTLIEALARAGSTSENASGEVAPLLAHLRELQRRHGVAVALVHHAKKGGGRARAGQALRGSSEFHAWGDSNLYLRRHGDDLTLTVEHRAAASVPAVALALAQRGDALALEVVERGAAEPPPTSVDERITKALADAGKPVPLADLRAACRVRNATLCERLATLTAAGRLVRAADGYRLAAD